jgi:membrane-associated phospholipid phosphatase
VATEFVYSAETIMEKEVYMIFDKSWKTLLIVVALGVAFSSVSAYPPPSRGFGLGSISSLETGSEQVTESSTLTSDAVTEWNQHAVTLTLQETPALAPVQQLRVLAIVQVAVHDAVNGITREFETYLSPAAAPQNASAEAAAIAAAHHALRNLFSSQAATLDALYLSSLAGHYIADDDPGIPYGRSAAIAIINLRSDDHSAQAQFPYDAPGTGIPGIWVRLNNAPALLPGWGAVTPFVLRSGWQFRPDAPPALDSELYARDYNEIKDIGVASSSVRTTEQTQIALFWRASPAAIWNPVLTQVLAVRNLDLSATARAFALIYMAASDAGVACWDAKYSYNFWRPFSAIRGGDSDGNDSTEGNGSWQPLIATPPHPEYPSGHSSVSAAMAGILASIFEDDPGMPISVTLTGITRNWSSFSEGVDEVIDARVYSGIHFRNSDEVGARLGRQVARFVLTHALRSCPKNGGRCF